MKHFEKQPKKFEIRPVIEQKPFENPAVQSFFAEWCRINDSIQPQIIDRDEWEKRGIKGVLEKRDDGKQILFIPKDLQLWEMVGVMEAVDQDTFAAKPERRTEAKEKLLALAKIFQNAGIYIAHRLNGIEKGREIAEALALEFYEYGQSLAEGKKPEKSPNLDDIASQNITPEETEIVDRFLAGDTLYESRQKRVEQAIKKVEQAITSPGDPSKKDELYENERQRTLSQFFKVAEKAFALESKSAKGELPKNPTKLWQSNTPIHSAFLKRIEKAITKKIETPKREFEMAIFRRGLEKLVREMRETMAMRDERTGKITPGWKIALNNFLTKLGLNPIIEQKKLIDVLQIPELKKELAEIRQTGDLAKISQKEREIADKIQDAVSRFPYNLEANNPAEMVAKQYINCVGASTLGGALMKEVGLNYLVGTVPEHSLLFLVTSDGEIEWRDMLKNASLNEKLTDEMIEGYKKDDTPLTVKDIVEFSQKPTPEGLMFDIKRDKKKFRWVKENQRQYITVFEPEYGQQIQILNNTGRALRSLGRYEEAVEAYRQAVALDPKDAYPYDGLGRALRSLGRYEEAIEAFQQAIDIDPKDAQTYSGLGYTLNALGRYEEAIEAFQQAIDIDPEYVSPYNGMGNALRFLGRYEEAIKAYQQAINIDPEYAYPYNGMGNALYVLHRYEEAIKAYQQAIKIDPEDAYSHNGLGYALNALGRYKEAIEAFQKFIELADKEKDDYWIKQAEQMIVELKSKLKE